MPGTYTRRGAAGLVLAAAVAPFAARPAAAESAEVWARRLESELNGRFRPGFAGRITVTGFEFVRQSGMTAMTANIRLDWPPGLRQRRFTARGRDAEAALAGLLAKADMSFSAAWPGCFG